jgi:tRNA (mo5U34)-methyltransferase
MPCDNVIRQDFTALYNDLEACGHSTLSDALRQTLGHALSTLAHGDLERWMQAISMLPSLRPSTRSFDSAAVTIGAMSDCDDKTRDKIKFLLRKLMPWRKGPYNLFGVFIDTEWRSDWKWNRVLPHISPLVDRIILDVGCGNGYHCWRMYGAGARLVIGIDPMPLFFAQFESVRHFVSGEYPVHFLPLGIDVMPDARCFDTVFSMGVFHHRRSPFDHLMKLKELLRPGGELVLETLVVKGGRNDVLVPGKRYAKMRNVWFIPSPTALETWLERVGFTGARTVDITPTTTDEQRRTDWMEFESLADFLDPLDPTLTVEGYPAPVRAVVICRRPV